MSPIGDVISYEKAFEKKASFVKQITNILVEFRKTVQRKKKGDKMVELNKNRATVEYLIKKINLIIYI